MADYEDKLSHLSAEQIETLYQRYLANEPVAVLLTDYRIEVRSSGLIKAFPPVPCADLACPWCEQPLYTRRRGKSQAPRSINEAFCLACPHRYYFPAFNRLQRFCICPPCSARRHHARHNEETWLRGQILDYWSLEPAPLVPYSTLGIASKLTLMALIEARGNARSDRLEPLEAGQVGLPLSPSQTMDTAMLDAMRQQMLLLIDPDSPIEAFKPNPALPRLDRVHWVSNLTLDGKLRASLTEVYRRVHQELTRGPQPEWHADLTQALRRLAVEEVYGYLERRCAENGLTFHARERGQAVAEVLVEKLPVCHIWDLTNAALRDVQQFADHCNVDSRHAVGTLPGKLWNLGRRAISEQWPARGSRQGASAPRSVYSTLLHGLLLGHADGGLERRLSEYLDALPDPTAQAPHAVLQCPECGATASRWSAVAGADALGRAALASGEPQRLPRAAEQTPS